MCTCSYVCICVCYFHVTNAFCVVSCAILIAVSEKGDINRFTSAVLPEKNDASINCSELSVSMSST